MIPNAELQRIRTGEATVQEARKAIRQLIEESGAGASAPLYTALRLWTWKALQTRRFDDEMTQWFRLLEATGSALSRHDPLTANYIEALGHLVDESVRYAASHSREQLVSRSHLGSILELVQRHNGRIDRDRIEEQIGLGKTRLSQLLSELVIAGALEREKLEDRRVAFVLTESGRELLELWKRTRNPEVKPDTPKVEFQPRTIAGNVRDFTGHNRCRVAPENLAYNLFASGRHRPERVKIDPSTLKLVTGKQKKRHEQPYVKVQYAGDDLEDGFDPSLYQTPALPKEHENA